MTTTAGAFDAHKPPSLALLGDCVHCGFCLSSCPTYTLWGEEMDSPRGRIDLMRQGVGGEPLSPSMVAHFDRCLGCMACVPACPSGVQYDALIEATRAQVERRYPRPRRDRLMRALIFATFPYRRRTALLRWPLRAYQASGLQRLLRSPGLRRVVPGPVRAFDAIAPTITSRADVATFTAATGSRRAVVGMLTGCVQSTFFSGVNAATVRVLSAEGCAVVALKRQGCCGALSAHNGREDEAQRFARALIDVFTDANVDVIVVNSAGCGSTMKEYGRLLRDDEAYAAKAAAFAKRTKDIAEFLYELGPVAVRHPLPLQVAYHDACHLSNAQGIRKEPRALLNAVPGLTVTEIPDGNLCCGSAGIYNLLQPDAATQLGDRKAANITSVDPAIVVAANPGCLMQISSALTRAGQSVATAHTIDILDASIRAASIESLAPRRCDHHDAAAPPV